MKHKFIAFVTAFSCLIAVATAGGAKMKGTTEENIFENEYAAETKASAYWDDGTPFEPVLRFISASDSHLYDWYQPLSDNRLANMFDDVYEWAETQSYKKVDAFVMNGDFVETGTEAQYERLNSILDAHMKPETARLLNQAGHEVWIGANGSHDEGVLDGERFVSFTGCDLAMHVVINGFDFITIPASWPVEVYEQYGSEWLANELEIAEARSGDYAKPIFVFHHHDIGGGRGGILASDWYHIPEFTEVLYRYPQIIYSAGHTHIPICHPKAVYQDTFTHLNTGTLHYTCHAGTGQPMLYPPVSTAYAGMYIVEVDAYNRVRVLAYNLVTREFMASPSSYEDTRLIYYIDKPGNTSTYRYTDRRDEDADVPIWENEAKIEVVCSGSGAKISFSQALDGECVEQYNLRIYDGETEVYQSWESSRFYLSPMPETITASVNAENLVRGKTYTVSIVAKDAFEKYSEPLEGDFTFSY